MCFWNQFLQKTYNCSQKIGSNFGSEPEIENTDSDFEKKLTTLIQSENKTFDWADSDIDDDCLPELGKEFVV